MMKRNLLPLSITAAAVASLFSLSVNAQTCASPNMWQPPAGGNAITSTTCAQDTTASGYCGGNFNAPGPAYVIQSNFTAAGTYTSISISGVTGFGGAVYVTPVSGGCGTNGACTAAGSPTSAIPSSAIPAGNYFIIVTAGTTDANNSCGAFTLTSNGTFPVALQNFSVN